MTKRFNRDYLLKIGIGDTLVTVRPPIRIAFSCSKTFTGHGVNRMDIKIYNLQESTRLRLVKDKEQQKYIPFELSIGYSDKIETIFKGSVHEGMVSRSGSEHIVSMSSLDGGYDFLNSFTSRTVSGKDAVINSILRDMPNTSTGKIRSQQQISRPKVLVGNSCSLIDQLINPGENWYIDNEQLYIIDDTEVVSRYIPVISSETGLKNTPERQERIVTVETMMNPSIKIGGLCELKSKNAPYLNGVYKVESMTYNGDLDGSEWGQSISMIAKEGYVVL